MQITSTQNPINRSGSSQPTSQTEPPEKVSPNLSTTETDKKDLTVAISAEAQALQKQAAAQQAESTQRNDNERTLQQQAQNLQAQPSAGKAAQRIDITV